MDPDGFWTDDEAGRYWLDRLRAGTEAEQCRARTELGLIFERRGLVEEAMEAYWANVQAGVKDRRPYEHLIALYRKQGDPVSEARVVLRMGTIFGHQPTRQAVPRRRRRRGVVLALGMAPALALLAAVWMVSPFQSVLHSSIPVEQRHATSDIIDDIRSTATPKTSRSPVQDERCFDAAVRFPESQDSLYEVVSAQRRVLNARGINPYSGNPLVRDILVPYQVKHAEVMAAWMAWSLGMTRHGRTPITLDEFVSWNPAVNVGTGPYIRPTLSQAAWDDLQAWPPDSCEGAFIHHPRNRMWVRLMGLSVGNTSWIWPVENGTSSSASPARDAPTHGRRYVVPHQAPSAEESNGLRSEPAATDVQRSWRVAADSVVCARWRSHHLQAYDGSAARSLARGEVASWNPHLPVHILPGQTGRGIRSPTI